MATKYSLGVSTVVADILSALQAQNLITELKYQDSTNLIFTTPLTDKVIRLYMLNSGDTTFCAYYGDAWTSGTTITNSVKIADFKDNASNMYLVTDTTFFSLAMNKSNMRPFAYVGSFDNGDEVVFGCYNIVVIK